MNNISYLTKTRLVEEVPGVPDEEKYYIWSGIERKVIWHGPNKDAGYKWAEENNIVIEEFEPFEL